ncbi:MAG: COX15/CtaA family protein [Ignavibacteria bacterium]
MNSFYKHISNITIALIILVIAAGSIVRATQSGMGCPDWPTCYGLIIPPTSVTQLPADYQQVYANAGIPAESFDAVKTWIEYINRLLGALLGLSVLIQTVLSFSFRKNTPNILYASIALLFLTGFQGWLGALVVSSNLAPYRITIHMLFAFLILLIANYAASQEEESRFSMPTIFRTSGIAMALMFLQILMGTQVREEIDVLAKSLDFMQRDIWIDNLSTLFPIHRSFSLVLLGIHGWILWQCKKQEMLWTSIKKPAFLLGTGLSISILSGIVMTYLSVPAFMQPVHLICASLIILGLHKVMLKVRS